MAHSSNTLKHWLIHLMNEPPLTRFDEKPLYGLSMKRRFDEKALWWKGASMKRHFDEKVLQWKGASMKRHFDEKALQWKGASMKSRFNEKALRWKGASMKSRFNEKSPHPFFEKMGNFLIIWSPCMSASKIIITHLFFLILRAFPPPINSWLISQ